MADKSTWYGKSGTGYTYNVYDLGPGWNDVPGNYIFAKTISTKDGPKWTAIYIGETDSFKNRLGGDHEKWDRALRYGMTHVHAHTGSTSRDVRRREEADLLAICNPPCND